MKALYQKKRKKKKKKPHEANFDLCLILTQLLNNDSYAAAAADKLLQSCPALCNPTDGSPPGSSIPGILQARILEWVAMTVIEN